MRKRDQNRKLHRFMNTVNCTLAVGRCLQRQAISVRMSSEDSEQHANSHQSSLSAHVTSKNSKLRQVDNENLSILVYVHADPSVCWTHMSYATFSYIVTLTCMATSSRKMWNAQTVKTQISCACEQSDRRLRCSQMLAFTCQILFCFDLLCCGITGH